MSRRHNSRDDSTKTARKRLLDEVYRETHYWLHQATRAQSGVSERSEELCRRELHNSVDNYWRQLKPIAERRLPFDIRRIDGDQREVDAAQNPVAWLWLECPLFQTPEGYVTGLYALRDWWDARQVVEETDPSVLTGSQATQHVKPVHLTIDQSRYVINRLDQLCTELGFGLTADQDRPIATIPDASATNGTEGSHGD
jgi:hypothetical protein